MASVRYNKSMLLRKRGVLLVAIAGDKGLFDLFIILEFNL